MITQRTVRAFCSQVPRIYGNNKSILSLSQWWNGQGKRPTDYFVSDSLSTEITEDWSLEKGMFRVVFEANLTDPSMDININRLKKSASLAQLIQLSAVLKERLVDNPSTVVIVSIPKRSNPNSMVEGKKV